MGLPLSERWSAQLSYAALEAVVIDGYLACSGVPCLVPTTLVAAGNRIPGVPQTTAFAELRWRHPRGWSASIDGRHAGAVAVNDLNAATADAYTLLNGSIGYRWQTAGITIDSFLRLENLFDRRYVGSVIVNDANSRFLEAGPGRTVRFGLETRLM